MPGKKELKDLVASFNRRVAAPPGNPPLTPAEPPVDAGRTSDADDSGGQIVPK